MLDMLSTLDIEIVIIIGVKMALRKHGHVISSRKQVRVTSTPLHPTFI